MTPTEIATVARQSYNAVGDSFFGDTELYNLIWRAEQQLAIETQCIQSVATTSTVASQREYTFPTVAIAVKRVTCDGRKLEPSDFMDDDVLTGYSEATTSTGTPLYYQTWGRSIFLRPIPSSVVTLKIYYYAKPAQVSSGSSLEIPEEYQLEIVNFILSHMAGKDGNAQLSAYYKGLWDESIGRIRAWERRKLRRDGAAAVKNLDAYSETIGVR